MLLTSIKEARKLANARVQPNLCFVPFSITDALAEIKAALFWDLSQQVNIQFVSLGSLTFVRRKIRLRHLQVLGLRIQCYGGDRPRAVSMIRGAEGKVYKRPSSNS